MCSVHVSGALDISQTCYFRCYIVNKFIPQKFVVLVFPSWCFPPELRSVVASMPSAPVLPHRVRDVPMRTSLAFHIVPSAIISVRPSLYSAVRQAHVIVVADMKPYDQCDSWDVVIVLIYAIGLGKIMIGERDWHGKRPWESPKAIRYKPHAKECSMSLVASPGLQRHGHVMAALRACKEDGKWSVLTETPAGSGQHVQHLGDMASVRQFLFKQRRIFRHRTATGTFQMSVDPSLSMVA